MSRVSSDDVRSVGGAPPGAAGQKDSWQLSEAGSGVAEDGVRSEGEERGFVAFRNPAFMTSEGTTCT